VVAIAVSLSGSLLVADNPDTESPLVSYVFQDSVTVVPGNPTVASPIVSYLAHDSVSQTSEPTTVVSPVVSYLALDSMLGTPGQPTFVSPLLSYLFHDWPGDENLKFTSSPLVSYDFATGNLETILITGGPTALNPRDSAEFMCAVTFAGGGSVDVSHLATWEVIAGASPGTGFVGNRLYISDQQVTGQLQIQARFLFPSGTRTSPVRNVSIGSLLRLSISQDPSPAGVVSLRATASGGPSPFVFNWDLNGDGEFDDATGTEAEFNVAVGSGRWRAGAQVTDANLNVVSAYRVGTSEKSPVPNQPTTSEPRYDVGDGVLVSTDGSPYTFLTDRTEKGLIVIVHGLRHDETEPWMRQMGNAIGTRLDEGTPNIALYGWGHYAKDPGELPKEGLGLLRAVTEIGSVLGVVPPPFNYADKVAVASDQLIDIYYVRKIALSVGQSLANWIFLESRGANPNIDRTKPIHLIGHSAGGFVVGECARYLETIGIPVDRITLLDTPFPEITHIGAGSTYYPNLGHVDQVISSVYGLAAISEAGRLTHGKTSHPYHHRTLLESLNSPKTAFNTGHSLAISWYTDETILRSSASGFYFSPFLNGPIIPRGGLGTGEQFAPAALVTGVEEISNDEPIIGFETFGEVSQSGSIWTLTEQADAGIWKNLTIPIGAESLKFTFQFPATGDGDFIAVRFGDASDLFYGQDLPISRENALPVEISLAGLQGESGVLSITLVSRNAPNAVATISEVRFGMNDDIDGDGLSNETEENLGSNPLLTDSDGDGLDDRYEVEVYGTNPALADTDGDGSDDSAEMKAGTSATDPGSVFRITRMTLNSDGSVALFWIGRAGRTYSVHRSREIGSGDSDTIASGVAGVDGIISHNDSGAESANRYFYWVQVE